MLRDAKFCRLLTGSLVALAVQVWSNRAQAQSLPRILDTVRLDLTAVVDSSAYLVYQYYLANSASSHGGVAVVKVDLSARAGTGHDTLPFTGSLGPGRTDVADHVPFGAMAPNRWQMFVTYDGALEWAVYEVLLTEKTAPVSFDSVPAGGVKSGFGVRSPYLPGVRRFSAMPTEQSCCLKPNDQGELPSPFFFPVRGRTVAATVRPQDMTLTILGEDLEQACGLLHWITEAALCDRLRSALERAVAPRPRSDAAATKGSLRAFLAELEAQHGTGKPVNDNAYWLLKVNGEFLLAHM